MAKKNGFDYQRNNVAAVQLHETERTGKPASYRRLKNGSYEVTASDGARWTISKKGNIVEHGGGSSGGGIARRMRSAVSSRIRQAAMRTTANANYYK